MLRSVGIFVYLSVCNVNCHSDLSVFHKGFPILTKPLCTIRLNILYVSISFCLFLSLFIYLFVCMSVSQWVSRWQIRELHRVKQNGFKRFKFMKPHEVRNYNS